MKERDQDAVNAEGETNVRRQAAGLSLVWRVGIKTGGSGPATAA
jgi:hypothetical protein